MSSIGQYIIVVLKVFIPLKITLIQLNQQKNQLFLIILLTREVVGDFNKEFTKYQKSNNNIVDPPRAGLSSDVIDKINNSKIRKIIYLSCNLRSLVSNLKQLTNYELQ